MEESKTLGGVRAEDLPEEIATRLDLKPGDVVTLTVTQTKPRRPVDEDRLETLLARFRSYAIKDTRSEEEILGYGEADLPT